MKCPYCLNEVNDNALFCGKCGQSLRLQPVEAVNTEIVKPKKKVWLIVLLTILSVLIVAASALAVLHFTDVIDLTKVFSTEQTESTPSLNDKEDNFNSNGNESNIQSGENNNIVSNPSNDGVLRIVTEGGDLVLDESYIETVERYFDEYSQQYGVLITFNEEGKELFANATRENIGKQLMIFVDDILVFSATVQEEIIDGSVIIGVPTDEVESLYESIKNAVENSWFLILWEDNDGYMSQLQQAIIR